MRRDEAVIRRFGANLRAARLERGMSQAELARETGLAVTEISRIERGVREVRLTTMMRLVDALGASPEELLSGLSLPVQWRKCPSREQVSSLALVSCPNHTRSPQNRIQRSSGLDRVHVPCGYCPSVEGLAS